MTRRSGKVCANLCTHILCVLALQACSPSTGPSRNDRSQDFEYRSSVDGEALTGSVYTPKGFAPDGAPVGLVCYLHAGDLTGIVPEALQEALDDYGLIGIAPDGRLWGLATESPPCEWTHSVAYVDSTDPAVGPGEQDIFDAIDWAVNSYPIDVDRIYLIGFSMGGRGTYAIGLKNPDRFAAIGPMAPAVDMYEVFNRRPDPAACKEGMTGGQPGTSPRVDTMYTITSGRFLIENAYNLPVFHGHGTQDRIANNDPAASPFLHGWHMTTDTSWDRCFGTSNLCFGHTPTLSELHARHPDGYDWAFLFTPVQHQVDPLWFEGTAESPQVFGVEHPQEPGELMGMFDFFETFELVRDPTTVVYKSYTDTHRKAYWVQIDISEPWTGTPGAIRATRDPQANSLAVELVGVSRATFDLSLAGLSAQPGDELVIQIAPLDEPVFDPALDASGELLQPVIVLLGDFSNVASVTVIRDEESIPAELILQSDDELVIGPLPIDGPTTLTISASQPAGEP